MTPRRQGGGREPQTAPSEHATLRPRRGRSARGSRAFHRHAALTATATGLEVTDRRGVVTRLPVAGADAPAEIVGVARTPSGRIRTVADLEVLDRRGAVLVHAPIAFDEVDLVRFGRAAGLPYGAFLGTRSTFPPLRPDCVYLDVAPRVIIARRAATVLGAIVGSIGAWQLTGSAAAGSLTGVAAFVAGMWSSR